MEADVVPVDLVRPLRQAVLRPSRPAQDAVFPGDDDPDAVHAAVRAPRSGARDGAGHLRAPTAPGPPGAEQVVVAVGSLLVEEPPPWLITWPGLEAPAGRGRWWRVRGMATAEGWRGRGLGRTILELLLDTAAAGGGGVVWCNARVAAAPLYRRAGFEAAGDVFELPGIGPHLVMWRVVPEP